MHLCVPGHAESLEPLVKDGGVGPGHVQGLVLEDVLVHPAADTDYRLSEWPGFWVSKGRKDLVNCTMSFRNMDEGKELCFENAMKTSKTKLAIWINIGDQTYL